MEAASKRAVGQTAAGAVFAVALDVESVVLLGDNAARRHKTGSDVAACAALLRAGACCGDVAALSGPAAESGTEQVAEGTIAAVAVAAAERSLCLDLVGAKSVGDLAELLAPDVAVDAGGTRLQCLSWTPDQAETRLPA